MNTNEILDERQKTHGDFAEHASITQGIKALTIWRHPSLSEQHREALEMIAHKIGRIVAGNPNHEDHWADIAGYAELGRRACKQPYGR
jgi:hypothetical protein